jgi:hypothetical protein
MIAVVIGFTSHVSALQFEWAWQHPRASKVARESTRGLWTGVGSSAKLRILFALLRLAPWADAPLRLHYLDASEAATAASLPGGPPDHVKVSHGPLEDLWIYSEARELLALQKSERADQRAAQRAVAKAAKVASRAVAMALYESSGDDDGDKSLPPPEATKGKAKAAKNKRRRSSIHRLRVKRISSAAGGAAAAAGAFVLLSASGGSSGSVTDEEDIVIIDDEEDNGCGHDEDKDGSDVSVDSRELLGETSFSDVEYVSDTGLADEDDGTAGSQSVVAEEEDELSLPLLERLAARAMACGLCAAPISKGEAAIKCPSCGVCGHVLCWGNWAVSAQVRDPKSGGDQGFRIVPAPGPLSCPLARKGCSAMHEWRDLASAAVLARERPPT